MIELQLSNIDDVNNVLLRCLRATLGDSPALLELSPTSGLWEKIAGLSSRCKLSPMLFRRLPLTDPALGIPSVVVKRWHREHLETLRRNSILFRELLGILTSLDKHSIPVILLKGAHLTEFVYNDRSIRPMVDIDILVRRQDTAAAHRIMRDLGYLDYEKNQTLAVENRCDSVYVHPAMGFKVEVHWRIDHCNPALTNPDELWQRRQPVHLDSIPAFILSPTDLLIHLCLHFSKHVGSPDIYCDGLRSLYDITMISRQYDTAIDWEYIQEFLHRPFARKMMVIPLLLATRMLGAPASEQVLESLRMEPENDFYAASAEAHVLRSCDPELADVEDSSNLLRLWGMRGAAVRIRHFLQCVFVPRREMEKLYEVSTESPRIYSCYALRMIDLLRRRGTALKLLVSGNPKLVAFGTSCNEMARLREWMSAPPQVANDKHLSRRDEDHSADVGLN